MSMQDPTAGEDAFAHPAVSCAPRSALETVVCDLRNGIVSGRYPPGYRLVESALTHELRVSRGPVREALRRLSAEGLIELLPHRGAMVRRLSFREAVELFQLRTAIDTLAVLLATGNLSDRGRRTRFTSAIAPIWSDTPRPDTIAYHKENNLFHHAIQEMSANEQLVNVSRRMHFPLVLFRALEPDQAFDADHFAHSVQEHRRIAELMLEGRRDMAAAAMRRHLESATARLHRVPRSLFRRED